MTDHRRGSDAGFTLIEVLVSLALLTLMLALVPQVLRLGRQAWQIEPRLEQSTAVAAARDVLSRRLAIALPAIKRQDGVSVVTFDGQPASLRFIAPAVESASSGGLQEFRLMLEPSRNAGTLNLVLAIKPAMMEASESELTLTTASDSTVLMEDASQLTIRYFGAAAQPTEDDAWQTRWVGRAVLPKLVEISFRQRDAVRGIVRQHQLVIRPRYAK